LTRRKEPFVEFQVTMPLDFRDASNPVYQYTNTNVSL